MWRLFIRLDASALGVIYLLDSALLDNPAYRHQGEIMPHWIYGLALALAAALTFANGDALRHRVAWIIIATIYVALALAFWPAPTALVSYGLIALFSYIYALR